MKRRDATTVIASLFQDISSSQTLYLLYSIKETNVREKENILLLKWIIFLLENFLCSCAFPCLLHFLSQKPSLRVLSLFLFSPTAVLFHPSQFKKQPRIPLIVWWLQGLPLHIWKVLILSSLTVYDSSHILYHKSNIIIISLSIIYFI